MSGNEQMQEGYQRRRKKRKKKSYGCLFLMIIVVSLTALASYGIYLYFFGGDATDTPKNVQQQSNIQQQSGRNEQVDPNDNTNKNGTKNNGRYDKMFGESKYLIHIHKQGYKLELFEKGKDGPVRTYGIAVAKNVGDKQRVGDNRTPTSWGKAVAIPKSYKGAEVGVASAKVPFRVEEICDASDWTHDFGDGKGVIEGAYGPWFISLDTGWDGIGIHGTHDPSSIGTKASEGCLRLKNSDVAELKKIIYKENKGVGTRVIITEE